MEKELDLDFLEKNQQPVTNWKNEPKLSDLKADLLLASNSNKKHINNIERWNDILNAEGKYKPKTRKGRSSVQPKLVKKQTEWRNPALTEPFHSSKKLFNVTPVTFEDEAAAKQNEYLINWQFRTKLNRISLIDNIVRSTVEDGTCIARVGWIQATKEEVVDVPIWDYYPIDEMDEESLMILDQAIQFKMANPRHYDEQTEESLKASVDYFEENGIPVFSELVGHIQEKQEIVTENYPTVDVLDPKNVHIDPSCEGNLDKALFIVNSYLITKPELEKQSGFINLDKVRWEDESNNISYAQHETDAPKDGTISDVNKKRAVAYDYWGYYDIHGNGEMVPIVATWIGDVLIRMEENPYPDGKPPFVVIPYVPNKRSLYGQPDAEILEDNQRTLGAIMRGIIDTFGRSANGQVGIAHGSLDYINQQKFDNDENYMFNPSGHPSGTIYQHTYPEVPNSAFTMIQIQNQEAEALTGVKSFSGGISGAAYGDVATGIRGALDAASKREMAILRRIAHGVKEIGTKIVAMNAAFLSKEETVRVTNGQYVEISIEDLQGNFDLEVDIATAEIDDAKANDLGFMLQTIGPNIDESITLQILAEIAELKRMPALAQQLRTFQRQPSPQEEEMMMLDLEAKRLEVEKLRSEIEFNNARARKALSDADLADLDYVEQETGTKHERELQKQQAQSIGNQRLALTKAMLDSGKNKESNVNSIRPEVMNTGDPVKIVEDNLPSSPLERDEWAKRNPALSLGSSKYDPRLDPSSNLSLNL